MTTTLKDQRAAMLKAATGIIDGAKASGRDVTDSENKSIEDLFTQIDQLDVKIAKVDENVVLMAKLANLGGPSVRSNDGSNDMFGDGDKEGFLRAARSKGSYGTTVNLKAATFSGGLLPAAGTSVSAMPLGLGAFPLRSLFTAADAEGPTVRYYRMGAGTAAVVAEGGLKPDSGVTTVAVDAALIKIASVFQISDELREDADFLIAAIQREVLLGTLVLENQQIGAALQGASGIFTATGTAATTLDVVADAVAGAEARDGITPGALVLNPVDLAGLRKAKASTAGSYFIDPLAAGPSAVHGVPLVSTAVVAAGTMLLLSEGAGVFYSRGGVRVEGGFSGDDWVRDLMTYRVEERVLPAIVRPSLVTKITLT